MPDLKETIPVRVNRLSFIGGSLRPKGTVANIKKAVVDGTTRKSDDTSEETTKRVRNSNIAPLGEGDEGMVPVVAMAAIAPTGPNPVKPQQVPAGTFSTGAGFFNDGNKLVAEGSAAEASQPGPGDVEIEEEGTTRLVASDDPDDTEGDDGRAKAIIEGTVDEVSRAIVGLNADQLDAVERAERAGSDRAGVHNALKAARANLQA